MLFFVYDNAQESWLPPASPSLLAIFAVILCHDCPRVTYPPVLAIQHSRGVAYWRSRRDHMAAIFLVHSSWVDQKHLREVPEKWGHYEWLFEPTVDGSVICVDDSRRSFAALSELNCLGLNWDHNDLWLMIIRMTIYDHIWFIMIIYNIFMIMIPWSVTVVLGNCWRQLPIWTTALLYSCWVQITRHSSGLRFDNNDVDE